MGIVLYQMLFEHRAFGEGCIQHAIPHNPHLHISPRTAAVCRADILFAGSDERFRPAQVGVCAADVMLRRMLLGADPLGKAAAGMRSCATVSPMLTRARFYLKCMFRNSAGHCRWMYGRWVSCCTRCCLGADPLGRGAARRRFCAMRSCSRPSMSPSLQSLQSLQSARTSSHGELKHHALALSQPSVLPSYCTKLSGRGNPAQLGHTEGKARHTHGESCLSTERKNIIVQ